MNVPHGRASWNASRREQRPHRDIEMCVRSSATCIRANLAMRLKSRLDWDEKHRPSSRKDVRPHLKEQYRAPWEARGLQVRSSETLVNTEDPVAGFSVNSIVSVPGV